MEVLKNGQPQQITYGVSNEAAWSVGLSCGGKMTVFIEKFVAFKTDEQAVWKQLNICLHQNKPCVLLTHLNNEKSQHLLVQPDGTTIGTLNKENLTPLALKAYQERKNQKIEHKGQTYFAQVFPRQSQLIIIGAAHITVDLVQLAKLYDFETIVIDPRGIFTNKTQFQTPPDQIFEQYPIEVLPNFPMDAYTYAVVLSHDPKIDDNALQYLLNSKVGYIGALGSRRTHAKRVKRLQEVGFSEEEIGRIYAPIGVDIKAKRPKEIALSIMGEIIKVKNAFL